MIVTAVVTMNTTVTATTPPMMAAVLSHSELLAGHSAWQTSEAAINSKIQHCVQCTLESVATSRGCDGWTVSGSSYITSSDSDNVDSGTLQLVYGVASASETATGALSSSVSLSPHHLPTGH